MSLTWFEHAARPFEPPPPPRWATPGELAVELDPKARQTPALVLIDKALVEAHSHAGRAPDHLDAPAGGKVAAHLTPIPLWALVQNPDLRVAITSYEAGVARRWGRVIRDDVTMNARDLGIRVRDDLAAQHEWQLDGHEGGVYRWRRRRPHRPPSRADDHRRPDQEPGSSRQCGVPRPGVGLRHRGETIVEFRYQPETDHELEASAFANDVLIPEPWRTWLLGNHTLKDVSRAAREIGVCDGAVLGYLHHYGVVHHRIGRRKYLSLEIAEE
ncbi:hypothetical protein PU560_15490 [Georgenia sp. 10Sc9-8]|uniref:Uncharacterized protein n=1 Tax=Georgenia halotolerans TaxID=3028317 RepID=A0ABT5U0K0_9MICO|nr:hypothetical protein [Georgenia halotolerans]